MTGEVLLRALVWSLKSEGLEGRMKVLNIDRTRTDREVRVEAKLPYLVP